MKRLICFIIFSLFITSAYSEEPSESASSNFEFTDIFSYEKPLQKGDNEKKYFFNISGGYTDKSGNTETVNTTYGFFAKYDNNLTTLVLNYTGSYGKNRGIVNDNRGTVTANFDYFLFWRFKFFFYTMSDYNRITKLEHRNGTGAGAKIYIIRNRYFLIDLSGAPILQYEKYEEQAADEKWKWSIRGRIELFPFDDDFTVKYYAFYIPSINNRNNYRTIQDVYLYKKLSGALGIKAGYRREYNTYDDAAFAQNPLLRKTDSTTYIQASLTL